MTPFLTLTTLLQALNTQLVESDSYFLLAITAALVELLYQQTVWAFILTLFTVGVYVSPNRPSLDKVSGYYDIHLINVITGVWASKLSPLVMLIFSMARRHYRNIEPADATTLAHPKPRRQVVIRTPVDEQSDTGSNSDTTDNNTAD